MLAFTYDMLPSRVVFGVGCLDKLPEEIERLGASRALVLSTPEQREAGQQMVDRLGVRAAGRHGQPDPGPAERGFGGRSRAGGWGQLARHPERDEA